jgi:hypothetical protein
MAMRRDYAWEDERSPGGEKGFIAWRFAQV